MSATGDRGAGDAGETLIEALAVVAIVGLVAAIAFPRLQQGLLALSQRQAVAVLTARVRQTRAEALDRDAAAVFAVAADGRSYAAGGSPRVAVPPGVTLSATPDRRIAFYGDGSSTGGRIVVRAGRRTTTLAIAQAGGVSAVTP